jgi:cytochrome c-type biogenesis protein CcmH/NrfG
VARVSRAFLIGAVLTLCAGLGGCESQSAVKPDEQEHIDPIVLKQQAEDAYQNKEWGLSEERYGQLAKEMPVEPEPWFRLGNIYARTQRPDLAVSAYREALVRDPRHGRAWHNMGVVQLQQAGRSFSEIQQFADESDPLYQRSREMVDAIDDLIHK